MSGDLLSALASLPDEALVPVGWIRERLAKTSIEHLTPESSARRGPQCPSGPPDTKKPGATRRASGYH